MPKIVIIGAGSLVFSSRLTADLLSYDSCKDAHFALVDIDAERLAYAGRICERMFKEGGYENASCSTHEDRTEALKDADYVISSLLVGGYDAIEKEIDISMKYGVDQAIGDTLTPGGIMRCMRTLPHQVGIAQDIMSICPNATLLNYTNPMGMLSWGMFKAAPGIKLVGLCHSVQGGVKEWAKRLELPEDEIDYDCFGINHQAWYTKFEHKGKDLLPSIRELAETPDVWLSDTSRCEYVKHFSYPVTESSGHNSEYSPWFRKQPQYIKDYCPGGSWNGESGFIKTLYDRKDWRETMEKMASWEDPVDLKRSLEYGSQIINAIEGGDKVGIWGNVMNNGMIDNLPQDAVVEGPIDVDTDGMHPQKCGALPTHLAAINNNQLNVQRLAMEAALEVDPEKVFQALCMDPLTAAVCTLDQIRNLAGELLEAHAEYIPAFKGKTLASKPYMVGCVATEEVAKHEDPAEERAPAATT
ncbi:MAG: alpha-galactosidase [Planctomycetes bacterium]|nr:alpha-galactosidase [Planctomycetota bacterium]